MYYRNIGLTIRRFSSPVVSRIYTSDKWMKSHKASHLAVDSQGSMPEDTESVVPANRKWTNGLTRPMAERQVVIWDVIVVYSHVNDAPYYWNWTAIAAYYSVESNKQLANQSTTDRTAE